MTTSESGQERATRLLKEQLKELESVRGLDYSEPQFKIWRATTRGYLEKFLPPNLPLLSTFHGLQFSRNVGTLSDSPGYAN